ncbi:MAG TPA: hypothetical protein VIY86_12725, partial [Pirellulaceae bacterium]
WLTNHHRFFGIPERTHVIAPQTRAHRTITEFIYVPDSVADGTYALALHVPDWILDAAPSRPILYPLELTE